MSLRDLFVSKLNHGLMNLQAGRQTTSLQQARMTIVSYDIMVGRTHSLDGLDG
jgi:hypothetical protein